MPPSSQIPKSEYREEFSGDSNKLLISSSVKTMLGINYAKYKVKNILV